MDLTAYELARMANKAASGFAETGDLTSEVAKLASENELTPPQIQTLVNEANHEVNRRLYSTEDDKRFAFKVATLDGVLDALNGRSELPKVASVVQSGFHSLSKDRYVEKVASDAVEPDWIRDPEMRLRETKLYLKQAADQLKSYADECSAKKNYLTLKLGESRARALGEIKQLVRNGTPFGTLYKAAQRFHADAPKAVRGIFEGFHKEYSKTASAVEKELLKFDPDALDGKDEIGTRIVNGNHPLFIHLDDMAADLKEYHDANICNEGLRNTFSAITSAIHRLNTPEDVDNYLANESQRFAYAVKKGMDAAITAILDLREALPKAEGHGSDKTAAKESWWEGPKGKAFAAKNPRSARALKYVTTPSGGARLAGRAIAAPVVGGYRAGKHLLGKGKELVTTGKTSFPALQDARKATQAVGKAVFSPAGLGTYNNPGLLSLAGLLWSGSQAAKGLGEAADVAKHDLMAGGSRSAGVGLS